MGKKEVRDVLEIAREISNIKGVYKKALIKEMENKTRFKEWDMFKCVSEIERFAETNKIVNTKELWNKYKDEYEKNIKDFENKVFKLDNVKQKR